MSYSANELFNLAAKAARGAGFPPEQANRFGLALPHFLAAKGEEKTIISALRNPDNQMILRLPLMIDGATVDLGSENEKIPLAAADLAAAYLNALSGGLSLCSGNGQLAIKGNASSPPKPLPARIVASEALINILRDLAQKTYVPSSEASRAAGAGAGDIDND